MVLYEDEARLAESVARFTANALASSEPTVVIATADHQRSLRDRLEASSLDVAAAIASGHLTLLDAAETLAAIMRDGMPDADRFAEVIGGTFARIASARPGAHVRAYGEMVDLLCAAGTPDAAIALEGLWNGLREAYSFSLFCAYSMERFSGAHGTSDYARVCRSHTHSFDAEAEAGTRSDVHHRLRAVGEPDAFRLIVQSVEDYAIFMLDPDGIVVTWNAGAERIKGYLAHEILGRHFSSFYPSEEAASGQCERRLQIAAERGRYEEEGWRVRKDGSRFWASVVITRLRDDEGAIVGFAKVTRDLTERRRAEADRERLLQAQEANRVKDDFLAVISHELRTPLHAILGWAQLLEGRAPDPTVEKAAAAIVRGAQAQARLIEDILDISRIVAGKLSVERAPEDLRTIVSHAVEDVLPAAQAKSIAIALDAGVTAPVMGDRARLQQVVSNLLSNAVKFTPAGGTIVVSLSLCGDGLRLTVRDTGVGIEPDFLPHVFERFRQGPSSTTGRASGLGLGLAIAHHLVELHGGTITVESAGAGTGSTFTVTLPLGAGTDDAFYEARGRDGLRGAIAGTTVLVVDDEDDARDMVAAILTAHGAKVLVASSAAAAREVLDGALPDVLVSDVGMPDEDGCALMRSVRGRPPEKGGEVPAVALTAFAMANDRRRTFDAGFDVHVPKPVDVKELVSAIEHLARVAARAGGRRAARPSAGPRASEESAT